jgi:lipoprotein-releasing system permease protein
LEVSGLFSITDTIDSKYIITPINFVEKLTNCLHKRTYWEVIIENGANVTKTQADIQKLLPKELKVSNRYEQNAAKRNAIYIERLSVYFIFTLVLLLASLHIFFMLCMLILEKKKDIALLAALGAAPTQIGKLFLYNGLLVSLEGILYGLIIAVTVGFLQQKFELITLTKLSRTGSVAYPVAMQGSDCLSIAMTTLIFGAFASFWPAKQAVKLANKEKNRTNH